MKKLLSVFILLTLVLSAFSSCESYEKPEKQTQNVIPEQSINYINFTFGNVIQDGKQAVFFNFASDYTVTKMEIAGTLSDKDGNVIHSFETSMTLSNPTYNPEIHIRIEAGLVKYVDAVSFTKINAYTTQELNSSTVEKLIHIVTLNSTTINNFYASGSTITVTNEKNKHSNGKQSKWLWFSMGFVRSKFEIQYQVYS